VSRVAAAVSLVVAATGTAAAWSQERTPVTKTSVVHYSVDAAESDRAAAVNGTCSGPSRAAGFRSDALACSARNDSYDPCFVTSREDVVICVTDPRSASGRVALRPTATPAASAKPTTGQGAAPPAGASHRAWFFELVDGTTCRPLPGPGREVEGQVEIYECKFGSDGPADAVLGDLNSTDAVWTISKVKINKMLIMTLKWSASVAVKTVWQ
jgi:hypothetical protein